MADKEFTLFEFHFDGLQIGPKTIGKSETDGESDSDEELAPPDIDVEGSGPGPVAGLFALVVLVGIALGIRRLLRGGEDSEAVGEEPIDEIETA